MPWLARNKPTLLMWSWNDPEAMLPVEMTVVMGHSPRPEPLDTGDVLAIDTGAGTLEDGRLTAMGAAGAALRDDRVDPSGGDDRGCSGNGWPIW